MPHYQVFIDGVEYPWSRIHYRRRAFELEAQPFEVEIPLLESISSGATIEIKRDGDTVIKGLVAKVGWRADAGGTRTRVEAFDYKRKLQLLKAVSAANPSEASTIIQNQLADTDLSVGTFNNYGSISIEYGQSSDAYFDRRRIIEDVLFITGWEFYVAPDGTCDFKSQCGIDRSSTVIFSRNEGTLIEWRDDYVESSLLQVKKVTVIGQGAGDAQASGSAQTADYSSGDPEKTINRRSLVSDSECASAAQALLDDMQNPVKYGVVEVRDVDEGRAFDIFDTIRIKDEALGIDETLRVAAIERWVSATEGERTVLTVTNVQHLQTAGPILIGEVRTRVEDDFVRIKPVRNLDEVDDGSNFRKAMRKEGAAFPSNPNDGDLFLKTDEATLYRYDASSEAWVMVDPKGAWDDDLCPTRKLTHGPTKAALKRYYLHGADGDAHFTANATFPRSIMYYNNLTIDSGVVVDCPDEVQYLLVKGTLTLNGTIRNQNGGEGGSGGGRGGNGGRGGGSIIIFANEITGSGTITVAGEDGGDATLSARENHDGNPGSDGSFKNVVIPGGEGGTTSAGGGGGGVSPKTPLALYLDELEEFLVDGSAGGGGEGCEGDNAAHIYGGGGGAGIWGSGGDGGDTTEEVGPSGVGGGGGGGGGFIMIVCMSAIPAITLNASGGDGGDAYSDTTDLDGGGGGGGGGGLIVCIAPTINAVTNVSGGAGGSGGPNGENGQPGEDGKTLLIQAHPQEVFT